MLKNIFIFFLNVAIRNGSHRNIKYECLVLLLLELFRNLLSFREHGVTVMINNRGLKVIFFNRDPKGTQSNLLVNVGNVGVFTSFL